MPRRWGVVVAACCLSLASCGGRSADVAAEESIGSVGDCYAQDATRTVDCADEHVAETVFVSDGSAPSGAAALQPCRSAQTGFLGQDFNSRLDVQLWVAADESWYRCDLFVRTTVQGGDGYEAVAGSLEGAFRSGAPVGLQSCLAEPYDPAADQTYAPCTRPHTAQELVVAPAIGTVDEAFPTDIADRAARACNASAAASQLTGEGRSVQAYYPENAAAWESGERTADCWVTAERGSLPAVQPPS